MRPGTRPYCLGEPVLLDIGKGFRPAKVLALNPLEVKHLHEPDWQPRVFGPTEDGLSDATIRHLDAFLDDAIVRWRSGIDGGACHDILREAHDLYKQAKANF